MAEGHEFGDLPQTITTSSHIVIMCCQSMNALVSLKCRRGWITQHLYLPDKLMLNEMTISKLALTTPQTPQW